MTPTTICTQNSQNPTAELLAECDARGIALLAHGDRLEIDAPKGELTPEFLARLRDCKPDLLAMLRGGNGNETPRPPGETAVVSPVVPQYLPAADLQPQGGPGLDACPRCDSCRVATGQTIRFCIDCEAIIGPVADTLALQPQGQTATEAAGWNLPSWPPVVPDSIIAAPVRICSDCERRRVVEGHHGTAAGLCWQCWLTKGTRGQNEPQGYPRTNANAAG